MGGQFKHYQEATQRLRVVVPMTLILILILLFAALKSLRHALLVLLCVPTAVTGGVLTLALRGMPLTISAVVGFLALSGIAVLNGVMLITYIQQLRRQGVPIRTGCPGGNFHSASAQDHDCVRGRCGFYSDGNFNRGGG